jgi:hypothetical protein
MGAVALLAAHHRRFPVRLSNVRLENIAKRSKHKAPRDL